MCHPLCRTGATNAAPTQVLLRAHKLLGDSPGPSAQESFRTAAAQRFPLARAFKTAGELQALDAKAEMDNAAPAGAETEEA